VQLPFLQRVLGEFSLVPLAVGEVAPDRVAEVLEAVWGGPETLVVISSDLSHYLPYHRAREVDRATVAAILDCRVPIGERAACGVRPLNGFLTAARRHRLRPTLLGLCNSGDTAGDRSRVVGYASIAWHQEDA
jgi:AmmeMemoRadiSam system protein B